MNGNRLESRSLVMAQPPTDALLSRRAISRAIAALPLTWLNPSCSASDVAGPRSLSPSATIQGRISVREQGARGDGVTDDTAAIRRAALLVAARGGGVLWFDPGTYLVCSDSVGDLCIFDGLDGVEVLGRDATIQLPNRPFAGSEGVLFHFSNCKHWVVDGLSTDGPHLDTRQPANPFPGYEFVRVDRGCDGGHMGRNRVKGCIAALNIVRGPNDPENYRSRNIKIDFLEVTNCAYGVCAQYSGDFLDARIVSDDVHRSLIAYGASSCTVDISNKDHKAYDCVVGTANASPEIRDWKIRYRSDVESIACSQSKVVLVVQGHSVLQSLNDIQIDLDVKYANTGDTGGAALLFRKQRDDGSSDDMARGHVFGRITVRGSVRGQGSETGPGVSVGSGTMATDINCGRWEGETFKGLEFKDLLIEPTSALGNPLFILGGAIGEIVLRYVTCTRDFIVRQSATDAGLPHKASLILQNVTCANRREVSPDGNGSLAP